MTILPIQGQCDDNTRQTQVGGRIIAAEEYMQICVMQFFRDIGFRMWHSETMQLTFDTKQIYRELSGNDLFSKEQAEKLTDTLRDVIAINTANLATKDQMEEGFKLLRAESEVIRSEIEIMQQKLTIRLGGIMAAGIAVLIALQQLG